MFRGVSPFRVVLILALAWVVIFGGIYIYLNYFKDNGGTGDKNSISTPEVTRSRGTPNPYKLPTGAQSYSFSTGSEVKGPKIGNVTIDPLDPKIGTKQTFTLTVESESPVTNASVVVNTDNKEENVILKLIEGTAVSGKFQGSWQVNDPYDYIYAFTYIVKADNGVYENTMFLRQ